MLAAQSNGNIWWYRPEGWLVADDRNMQFFLVLNLTVCIKAFTFNNTILSVSFLNDISPFGIFFGRAIIELRLGLGGVLLAGCLSKHSWVIFLPKWPIFNSSVTIYLQYLCDFYCQNFWLIHICYRIIGNKYDLWFKDVWFIWIYKMFLILIPESSRIPS